MAKFKIPFDQIVREKKLIRLNVQEYLCDAMFAELEDSDSAASTVLIYDVIEDEFYTVQYELDTDLMTIETLKEDLFKEYREGFEETGLDSFDQI